MEKKAEFEGDHLSEETSFSRLLFGDDVNDVGLHVDHQTLQCSSGLKTPKMLCFGSYQDDHQLFMTETHRTHQKSAVTCSDSSSASTCNNIRRAYHAEGTNKSNKKRNGLGQEPMHCTSSIATSALASQRTTKKTKTENPFTTPHAKRKEKLGERIAALQQLVSPFGKTDTASVLHEAMGYIKFLHDQVQVLCSPYLQRRPPSPHDPYRCQIEGQGKVGEETNKDLRRRGLCLVPVECTIHVASSNGADFWSPAMGVNNVPSISKE